MSTATLLNGINNDDDTNSLIDNYSFEYDRKECKKYFAHNAFIETTYKGPSYLVGITMCNTNTSSNILVIIILFYINFWKHLYNLSHVTAC